jgi:hypothetical protein
VGEGISHATHSTLISGKRQFEITFAKPNTVASASDRSLEKPLHRCSVVAGEKTWSVLVIFAASKRWGLRF